MCGGGGRNPVLFTDIVWAGFVCLTGSEQLLLSFASRGSVASKDMIPAIVAGLQLFLVVAPWLAFLQHNLIRFPRPLFMKVPYRRASQQYGSCLDGGISIPATLLACTRHRSC